MQRIWVESRHFHALWRWGVTFNKTTRKTNVILYAVGLLELEISSAPLSFHRGPWAFAGAPGVSCKSHSVLPFARHHHQCPSPLCRVHSCLGPRTVQRANTEDGFCWLFFLLFILLLSSSSSRVNLIHRASVFPQLENSKSIFHLQKCQFNKLDSCFVQVIWWQSGD